ITILTKALTNGAESVAAELEESRAAVTALNESSHLNNLEVQEAIANLKNVRVDRELPFAERIKLQHAWLKLPLFPTTT
ncbi:5-methyltetrahydropteroyltriglutamate--homocysteine S-methyltransferase, partial [Enterococcus faecium]